MIDPRRSLTTRCRAAAASAALLGACGGGPSAPELQPGPPAAEVLDGVTVTTSWVLFVFGDGTEVVLDFADLGCRLAAPPCEVVFGLPDGFEELALGFRGATIAAGWEDVAGTSGVVWADRGGHFSIELTAPRGSLVTHGEALGTGGEAAFNLRGAEPCTCRAVSTARLRPR